MPKREEEAFVNTRLEGKVTIITGGASGIGEATVVLFVIHGANVIIADIAAEAGIKLAESLSPYATFIHCDVTKEQDVRAAVDFAIENFGRLDIMFNNAGTMDIPEGGAPEYDMEEFERVMNVNVKGVMHGMKHAARVMIPSKKGTIISTGSISGVLGGEGSYAYTASKHAIIGLTKNGAAELGNHGIRVNCVSPSAIPTNIGSQFLKFEMKAMLEAISKRIANLKRVTLKAEDIAEAALYLASEESKYVSGHNLVVDGGFTVIMHAISNVD